MKSKKSLVFVGIYKKPLEGYVAYKRSLGFNLEDREMRQLVNLNEYLNGCGNDSPVITEDMVEKYLGRAANLSSATIHAYECRIRQVALYMRNCGYEAFVLPENHIRVTTDFVPYIFSYEEMQRIFSVTDSLPNYPNLPHCRIYYQTIIRLLYGTGMRISEALALTPEDVNLENKILIIRSGKGDVARIIPYHDTLSYWLCRYSHEVCSPNDTFFFEAPRGGKRNRCAVKNFFEDRILKGAGIPRKPDNTGPRLHDLRHTYACHALSRMVHAGMYPFCALPYLSTYMGHKGIESTEKYLRLTEEHFHEITEAGHYIYEKGMGDGDE